MHSLLPSIAQKWHPSIVRVHAVYNGILTVGTGFYITPNVIQTCAHVVLGHTNLRALLDEHSVANPEEFLQDRLQGADQLSLVDSHGQVTPVDRSSIQLHGATDSARISVQQTAEPIPIDASAHGIGEDIYLLGYPTTIQIDDKNAPYAACKGNIMSEGQWQIGGYKTRPMLKLYCPAFGGASGSPIFTQNGECFAMLHGQMRWGDDHFLFSEKDEKGQEKTVMDAFHVPLPFGFGAIHDLNKLSQ